MSVGLITNEPVLLHAKTRPTRCDDDVACGDDANDGRERGDAGVVVTLLALLLDAPPADVLDQSRLDPGAGDQGP